METPSPATPALPPLRIDNVRIVWERDDAPPMLGDPEVECIGCYAVAEVSYPMNGVNGDRRLETLKSGGLWGIDSKSHEDYRAQVEREQLEDLAEHLKVFGVPVTAPLVVTA